MIVDDLLNAPYGSRSDDDITRLTHDAVLPLVSACDVVVIACNTATTVAIRSLRDKHPHLPFIGFEPMVKTAAALTTNGRIAVLATPATLRSRRYKLLKRTWAGDLHVAEPDCSTWAGQIETHDFDESEAVGLAERLAHDGIDVISLACTHYLYLENAISQAVGQSVTVLNPIRAINAQITHVLAGASSRR